MTGAEFIAFLGASVILAVTPGPDTFLTLRFAARSVRAGLVYTVAAGSGVLVWAVLALTGVAALLERFPDVRAGLTWVGGTYLIFLGVTALLQVRRARRSLAAHAAAESAGHDAADPEVPVPERDDVPVVVGAESALGAPDAAMAGVEFGPVAGATAGAGTGTGAHGASGGSPAAAVPSSTSPTAQEAASAPRLPARSLPTVFRTGLISSLTNPKTGLFFLALLPPFLPASPGPVDHVVLVATVVGCMLVYGAGLSVIAGRVGRFLTGGSGPLIVDGVAGAILVALGLSLIVL